MKVLASLLLLAACAWAASALAESLPKGKFQFEFVDRQGDPARPVKVWMFVPDACDRACPLQFVMHGVKRNGEDYLDNWVDFAKAGRFIVVTPEFDRRYFPRDEDYSLGRSTSEPDPAKWAFAVPEHLFDHLRGRYGFTATRYRLFGHSAGGQFVHRLHLFHPDHRADPIIAANPGWYTLPQWGMAESGRKFPEFPYSTLGSRIDAAMAKRALSRTFVLMLGDRDIDPRDESLNKSAAANEQGLYRLARGEYFFAAAGRAADLLGAPFPWRKVIVPGVAHDNARMAAAAIDYMKPPAGVPVPAPAVTAERKP